MHTHYALTRAEYERELDVTLAGSFPASDPPPWTLGIAPEDDFFGSAVHAPVPAAIDVVIDDGRRFGGIRLASLAEAIAMTATIPLAILIAGAPVLAGLWAVSKAIAWLAGGS